MTALRLGAQREELSVAESGATGRSSKPMLVDSNATSPSSASAFCINSLKTAAYTLISHLLLSSEHLFTLLQPPNHVCNRRHIFLKMGGKALKILNYLERFGTVKPNGNFLSIAPSPENFPKSKTRL